MLFNEMQFSYRHMWPNQILKPLHMVFYPTERLQNKFLKSGKLRESIKCCVYCPCSFPLLTLPKKGQVEICRPVYGGFWPCSFAKNRNMWITIQSGDLFSVDSLFMCNNFVAQNSSQRGYRHQSCFRLHANRFKKYVL